VSERYMAKACAYYAVSVFSSTAINPTTKYRCEFDNLNCISAPLQFVSVYI